jgi:hypothetical protein
MTINTADGHSRISRPLVVLAAALFVVGVVNGGVGYAHRSSAPVVHSAGTSAWPLHLVLAACTAAILLVLHRRRALRDVLLAPWGSRAARRVRLTLTSAWRGPVALGRAVVSVPFALMYLYGFWRAGQQVLGGLDPSFTVNAWGGPTYAGAMFCHYLDGALIMAACALVLDRVLAGRRATDSTLVRA